MSEQVKKGTKEQAIRAAREETLMQKLNDAVDGMTSSVAHPPTEDDDPTEKEKPVKRKKTARQGARTPVRNGRMNGHVKTKRQQIVELARHKHGCTNADVFALTGWPTVSMPQVAESQGVLAKLRIVKKEGEPTRYFIAA